MGKKKETWMSLWSTTSILLPSSFQASFLFPLYTARQFLIPCGYAILTDDAHRHVKRWGSEINALSNRSMLRWRDFYIRWRCFRVWRARFVFTWLFAFGWRPPFILEKVIAFVSEGLKSCEYTLPKRRRRLNLNATSISNEGGKGGGNLEKGNI